MNTMNEPLMHATIALAARCAERDTPPTTRSARLIAQELAHARGLDRRDSDALCDAARSFAAPLEELRDSLQSLKNLTTHSTESFDSKADVVRHTAAHPDRKSVV